MPLPLGIDPARFSSELRANPAAWLDEVVEICGRIGLRAQELEPFPDGSNLVAAVGRDHLVKVFPPFHQHQFESESRALPLFAGRLPIPVPELLATGALPGGWTYVVMTRLRGVLLESVWPSLDRAARVQLLREVGRVMAAAHALDAAPLQDLPPPWDGFVRAQIVGCKARHQRLGAPAWLTGSVDEWIAARRSLVPDGAHRVVLTGEYTPFNLLVDPATAPSGAPRLVGMFDFGDTMLGPPDYDLLGPATFLAAGDPVLLTALLDGYGLPLGERTRARRERWMVLLLLHRYSHLRVQVRLDGWQELGSIGALAERLFPIA